MGPKRKTGLSEGEGGGVASFVSKQKLVTDAPGIESRFEIK
jgi:hypothetical protein